MGSTVVAPPLPPVMVVTPATTRLTVSPPASVSAGAASGEKASSSQVVPGKTDSVRIAKTQQKRKVYVCFEGTLGAHLKQEVQEKISKGEYVEIFFLLPLEKFNLDRRKPDDTKKEDEEKRRYRLIPWTFAN